MGPGVIVVGLGLAEIYQRLRRNGLVKGLERVRPTVVLWTVSPVLSVLSRNWRSVGYRALRLRRVDVYTGLGLSVRSAVLDALFDMAVRPVTGLLRRPLDRRIKREHDRVAAHQRRINEIEREYADDPEGRQRALMVQAIDVNPLDACGWQLLVAVLWNLSTSVVPWRGRTIRERVTGTVVVVDA
jgi:hypothetical protein